MRYFVIKQLLYAFNITKQYEWHPALLHMVIILNVNDDSSITSVSNVGRHTVE